MFKAQKKVIPYLKSVGEEWWKQIFALLSLPREQQFVGHKHFKRISDMSNF